MKINDHFDKIYCINLKHRKDRWESAKSQFDKFNMEVSRFEAINGKEVAPNGNNNIRAGEIGILRSNYEIIKEAKEKKYKQIMIFEDDVELDGEFGEKFNKFYPQVPPNWAFLYMGGNHIGGFRHVTANIASISHTYAIHAFCIKDTLYDPILTTLIEEKHPVDVIYANLQKDFPSYVFRPHIAYQSHGFSDINDEFISQTHPSYLSMRK